MKSIRQLTSKTVLAACAALTIVTLTTVLVAVPAGANDNLLGSTRTNYEGKFTGDNVKRSCSMRKAQPGEDSIGSMRGVAMLSEDIIKGGAELEIKQLIGKLVDSLGEGLIAKDIVSVINGHIPEIIVMWTYASYSSGFGVHQLWNPSSLSAVSADLPGPVSIDTKNRFIIF